MRNDRDLLRLPSPSAQVTGAVVTEISIVSEIVRAAENANPHPPSTARTGPDTRTDHEAETETANANETERRIEIAIASTDTATPATIPKKSQSENDPRHPKRKRNPSRLPSKKSTPQADPQLSPTQTASRSEVPVAVEKTQSTSSQSIYPLDPVKTVYQPQQRELIARKKEKRKKIGQVLAEITTLAPHATNPPALAHTTVSAKKRTSRNPPPNRHYRCPRPLPQPKTKTRTNSNAKPEIASACSKKHSVLLGWREWVVLGGRGAEMMVMR
jgi:hypothetical protein